MKKECARCEYWKRDGIDGICFHGCPQPRIVKKDSQGVLMWPRTKPEEFCSGFSEKE